MDDFIQQLQTGTLHAVSDGSFLPEENIGAAVWVIETTTETSIMGAMPTVGSPDTKPVQK